MLSKKNIVTVLIFLSIISQSQILKSMETTHLCLSDWTMLLPDTLISKPLIISTNNVIFSMYNHHMTFTTPKSFSHKNTTKTGDVLFNIPFAQLVAMRKALNQKNIVYLQAHNCSHIFRIAPKNITTK